MVSFWSPFQEKRGLLLVSFSEFSGLLSIWEHCMRCCVVLYVKLTRMNELNEQTFICEVELVCCETTRMKLTNNNQPITSRETATVGCDNYICIYDYENKPSDWSAHFPQFRYLRNATKLVIEIAVSRFFSAPIGNMKQKTWKRIYPINV